MTTEQAEKQYLSGHKQYHADKGWAVYNPNNKPISELPTIYGFNNVGSVRWYTAQLMAEDGTALGSHVCSHEGYMSHDLGILEGSRPDRHEHFKAHYPEGYKMEFISIDDVASHKGLSKAYELNQKRGKIGHEK